MAEGFIINSTARMCDVSKLTIQWLLADFCSLCRDYRDLVVRGLACRRVQVDEVWSFVGRKKKSREQGNPRGFKTAQWPFEVQ